MAKIAVNGCEIYYEDTRAGAETVVLAHGLLWNCRMFDEQVLALKDSYRCISFDFRGQGQTEVVRTGYDMDSLTEDAAALIQKLAVAPCHFLGLSMGGFVGMRLALRHPNLLRSLILLETSADAEPAANVPRYKLLSFISRWLSMRLVAGKVMPIMFGQKFLNDPTRQPQRDLWLRRLLANDNAGAGRATQGVISRQPVYEEIRKIQVPTLILCGDQDVATPRDKAERIQSQIANSRLVIIPGAGHSSTIEEPAAVNAALLQFLEEQRRA